MRATSSMRCSEFGSQFIAAHTAREKYPKYSGLIQGIGDLA
jgi:hypothetical protein